MLKTHDFYYDLPQELIAQTPLERRDTPEFHRYFNAIWKELDVHA